MNGNCLKIQTIASSLPNIAIFMLPKKENELMIQLDKNADYREVKQKLQEILDASSDVL